VIALQSKLAGLKRDADATESLNRRLNERIDRQRDVIDRCRIAYNAVRGLFDDDSGAGRMA
jgi:hypothetical protein